MAPTYISRALLDSCWAKVSKIPVDEDDDVNGGNTDDSMDPDTTSRSLSDEIAELKDDSKNNGVVPESRDTKQNGLDTGSKIAATKNTTSVDDTNQTSTSFSNTTISTDYSFVYFEDFKTLNSLIEESTDLKLFQPSDFALIYSQFEEQKEDPEATAMSKSDVIFFYDSLLDVQFVEDSELLKNVGDERYSSNYYDSDNFTNEPSVFNSSSIASFDSPVRKIRKPKKPLSVTKTKLKTPVTTIQDKKSDIIFDNTSSNYKKGSNGSSNIYKLQNGIHLKEQEIKYRDELINKLEIQLAQFDDKTKTFEFINEKLNKEQTMNQQYNDELLKMTNDLIDLQNNFKSLKAKNENLVKENSELSGCIVELTDKVSNLEKKQNDLISSSPATNNDNFKGSLSTGSADISIKEDNDFKELNEKLKHLTKNQELENSKLLKKIELLEKNLVSSNLRINLFHEKFKILKNNKLSQFNKLQDILQRQSQIKKHEIQIDKESPNKCIDHNSELVLNERTTSSFGQAEEIRRQVYEKWLMKLYDFLSAYNITYKQIILFYTLTVILIVSMKSFGIFSFDINEHDDNSIVDSSSSSFFQYYTSPKFLLSVHGSTNHNVVDTISFRMEHDHDFQMFVNENN